MSINDPQWGNSHRPDNKEPAQVPDAPGTEPVQPVGSHQEADQPAQKSPTPTPPPPEGPPDLEEIWQQLVHRTHCQIARLFGKELPVRPSAAAPVPPAAPNAAQAPALAGWQALTLKSWLIGVSLIVGAWLVSGFYLVDTQQRGLLSRFGAIRSVEEPGWHWRWPYPVESLRLVNVTADRTLEIGLSPQKDGRANPGLMLTSDGNLVGLGYVVTYQVSDPVAYLAQAEAPVDVLALLADRALRESVAEETLVSVQGAKPNAKQVQPTRQPLVVAAQERLQRSLASLSMGITLKGLAVRDVQWPAAVVQAVKDADRLELAREKQLREAQADATERLIKAHQLAAQLQNESTAYAQSLGHVAQALGRSTSRPDPAQAQQKLAEQSVAWQQQYPLVFLNQAALQARVAPNVSHRTEGGARSGEATQSAPSAPVAPAGAWRDREIMRSRDRTDRPESGS